MITSYTSQEQATVAQATLLACFAIVASALGVVLAAIAVVALSREIVEAARKYPQNPVIHTVFLKAALRSGAIKLTPPTMKPEDVKAGVLVDPAIAAIKTALNSLHGKATPEEISRYKAFIYACATAVAQAAGSEVSEQKKLVLAETKAAPAI